MSTATDTLSLVIDALAYPWKGGQAKENLLFAAEAGTLEVTWTLVYEDMSWGQEPLELVFIPEAVDTSTPPCWDDCNGISTLHRPGWCRHNPEHADFDCGCRDLDDYDYDDEVPARSWATVSAEDVTFWTDDEPF